MNLLLILSALLSALSGVGQAVRGVRAPQTVCATMARCATVVRQKATAARPQQALPPASRSVAPVLVALRLPPAEPLFASRRRE